MLGLFDSGSGGLNTVRYIKENMPDIDLVYKIDRENAPYGIKSTEKIIQIVEENIDDLKNRGAERILIACCTASTVYGMLAKKYKNVSIPIINPIAVAALQKTRNGRIGVLATEHTVRSHAFKNALPSCTVTEIAAQKLVGMIDGGLTDNNVTLETQGYVKELIYRFYDKGIDTLILGCTHFPAIKATVAKACSEIGIRHVIDSAREGALAITTRF